MRYFSKRTLQQIRGSKRAACAASGLKIILVLPFFEFIMNAPDRFNGDDRPLPKSIQKLTDEDLQSALSSSNL